MYKSINYWTFGPEALAGDFCIVTAMEQAKKAGFEGIELGIGDTGQLTFTSTEKQCKQLAAEAKRIGIKIAGVATGYYWGCSPTSDKKSERDKALKVTKQALQVTKWLGANTFLYIPGVVKATFDPDMKPVPYGDVYTRAVQQAKAAAKVAEKLKVYLCCENVWNSFLLSPIEMRDFIKTVGSRWVGVYFDPANIVEYGYAEHWIPVLGKMIKRVHCKDYSKKVGGFPGGFEVPIGKGDTPWPVILKQLKKVGYKGPISAEIISFEKKPNLVKQTSKQMDKIMASV